MSSKYQSHSQLHCVRVQRFALRLVLARLARWTPLDEPRDGYTVIIGCNSRLPGLLMANLRMLTMQDRTGLDRIFAVIDRPESEVGSRIYSLVREEFPNLPVDLLYYSPTQSRVTRAMRWAWVYSWLSWSIGLAATRTRYVLLHDLDSMLIASSLLRRRYETIVSRGHEYLGTAFYEGNGVIQEDGVVKTYELILDAAYFRSRFRPIDAFNHVTDEGGRCVDWDTFLWAQKQGGQRSVLPIPEQDMVHPSQMICQFTQLLDAGVQPSRQSNLYMLPYFEYIGGLRAPMLNLTRHLRQAGDKKVPFYGVTLRTCGLSVEHAAWLRKQAYRLEQAVRGSVRPDVKAYFDAVAWIAECNTTVAEDVQVPAESIA